MAVIPKLVAVLIMGIMQDLIGRRGLISITLLFNGLALAHTPFASPNFRLLYLDLVLSDIFLFAVESNPLGIDYAAKKA